MKKITFLAAILFCSITYSQSTTILIESIRVEKVPATKPSGKAWDNFMEDYKPDVYIQFFEKYHEKALTSNVGKNFTSGSFKMNQSIIIMADDLDTLTLTFYDEDSVTEDDYMGSYEISSSKLKRGTPKYSEIGSVEYRTLEANDDSFKFTMIYMLKSDIDKATKVMTKKTEVVEVNSPKTLEENDRKNKGMINGNWESSCGRLFMLVALGSTQDNAMIKQFVGGKEIVFKPIKIGDNIYFQTEDKTKKFIIQEVNLIQYETSDGFKCSWKKVK